MNNKRSLLDWFSKRKEDFVQRGMRKHCLAIIDSVNEAERSISAMSRGDPDTALRAVDRLILSEREADRIEEKLVEQLTIGELDPDQREDLMHLVKKMDKIADWAMDAGVHVQLMIETGIEAPPHIWEALRIICSELTLAVRLLLRAVESIGDEPSVTLKCVQNIKGQERAIDEINYAVLKKILMAEMDFRATILMKGMLQALETSSDRCKECADTIAILISSR